MILKVVVFKITTHPTDVQIFQPGPKKWTDRLIFA